MAKAKYDLAWCQNYAKSRGGQCLSDGFCGLHGRLTYRCAEGVVAHNTLPDGKTFRSFERSLGRLMAGCDSAI